MPTIQRNISQTETPCSYIYINFVMKKRTNIILLPSLLLSTPSHVNKVFISFKCPASKGASFSVMVKLKLIMMIK